MLKQLLVLVFLLIPSLVFADTLPFQPGEKLVYRVHWFFIDAGEATLEVAQPELIDGVAYPHFISRAKSDLIFFYTVNDRVESVSADNTLLPFKFEKHLREGGYKKDQVILFDPKNNTAKYGDTDSPVTPGCRDPLAAFYYLRGLDLPAVGGELIIWVHVDKKNYPLLVQVLKKEKIKVPAGEFDTVKIKLRPQPGFEGLFRHQGNIWIWLTDDPARVPVKVKAEVPIIGSVEIDLKSANK